MLHWKGSEGAGDDADGPEACKAADQSCGSQVKCAHTFPWLSIHQWCMFLDTAHRPMVGVLSPVQAQISTITTPYMPLGT
mmetsp:Transcript_117966/g.205367  ORF Transcript_117966/g.205367 Transcript_117966/m.205367 type:complete len:80 (-) Transcript_117966:2084-2323(-)